MQILILEHWGIRLLCIQPFLVMFLITRSTNRTGLNIYITPELTLCSTCQNVLCLLQAALSDSLVRANRVHALATTVQLIWKGTWKGFCSVCRLLSLHWNTTLKSTRNENCVTLQKSSQHKIIYHTMKFRRLKNLLPLYFRC